MAERIAVETLTLSEISDLFRQSLEAAFPKAKSAIDNKIMELETEGVTKHKWIEDYEIFKGAQLKFYCEKITKELPPLVSIGMTHRTSRGMILIAIDVSNGGISEGAVNVNHWQKWLCIYTAHFCERFAERIMKADSPTFKVGSDGIMLSDTTGVARVTQTLPDGIDEIEFQFKDGQSYGYRDSRNKVTYFRTVYSNDMLKGERLQFREEWREPVEVLNELFKIK